MKTLSELTDFYYQVLFKPLEALEKDRKQVRHRIAVVGVLFTLFTLVLCYFIFSLTHGNTTILMLVAFGYFFLGSIIYKMLTKDYTKEFKEKIIAPLIKEFDSNLSYLPLQHISQRHFQNSKLFSSRIDRFRGNDFVHGKIDDVNIEFSDVHAEKKTKNSKNQDT